MKSPLRSQNYTGEYGQQQYDDLDCLQEKCAWWDEALESCDPSGLATVFIALGNTLGVIADRMPKDLAPR